jgi:hypothetical protein
VSTEKVIDRTEFAREQGSTKAAIRKVPIACWHPSGAMAFFAPAAGKAAARADSRTLGAASGASLTGSFVALLGSHTPRHGCPAGYGNRPESVIVVDVLGGLPFKAPSTVFWAE